MLLSDASLAVTIIEYVIGAEMEFAIPELETTDWEALVDVASHLLEFYFNRVDQDKNKPLN